MLIDITVVYSPGPRQTREWKLQVEEALTIERVLETCVLPECPELSGADLTVGIWGRMTDRSALLKNGDRLEIYRPLTVDPKIARRKRFKSQGARGAGLFAKKKVGKEAGY